MFVPRQVIKACATCCLWWIYNKQKEGFCQDLLCELANYDIMVPTISFLPFKTLPNSTKF